MDKITFCDYVFISNGGLEINIIFKWFDFCFEFLVVESVLFLFDSVQFHYYF